MKLLRYGNPGQEKPGMLDQNGTIRDLSNIVEDIAGDAVSYTHLTLPTICSV